MKNVAVKNVKMTVIAKKRKMKNVNQHCIALAQYEKWKMGSVNCSGESMKPKFGPPEKTLDWRPEDIVIQAQHRNLFNSTSFSPLYIVKKTQF